MKLAFYRGPGNWVTRLIRRATNGPYSHVELVFSDNQCFSASGQRSAYGVRWVRKDLGSTDWDFVELKVTEAQELAAREFADTLVGLCFAWRGLLNFLVPWVSHERECWFCSEIVLVLMQKFFGMHADVLPRKVHPNQLYRMVTE